MKSWKTRTRLFAGFGAVMCLIMMLSAFTFWQLRQVKATVKDITDDQIPCMNMISKIQLAMQSRFALLLEHVYSDDAGRKSEMERQIEATRDEIQKTLDKYESMIDDRADRRLFEELKAARAPYLRSYMQVLGLSSQGRRSEAVSMMRSRLAPLRDAFFKATEAEAVWNRGDAARSGRSVFAEVDRTSTGMSIGLGLCLVASFLISVSVTRAIALPLARAVEHLGKIAQGDLASDTGDDLQARGDEVGMLARAKQTMIGNLRAMIHDMVGGVEVLSASSRTLSTSSAEMTAGSRTVSDKVHLVAAAAEQMSANVASVAAGMEHTADNLNSVSTATDQMTSTIGEIAGSSEKARRITEQANHQAARVTEQIAQLGQAVKEIGKVTETITEISSQTNLLALNASIEAARAGAAGKGFAVVAGEIKALAQQTTDAAEDIKARISGVQSATAEGIVEIEKVSGVIVEVGEIVVTIAAAIEEQSVATKDIARNIAEAASEVAQANLRVAESSTASREIARDIQMVDQVTQEMATGTEHVRSSSSELEMVAGRLKATASRFWASDGDGENER